MKNWKTTSAGIASLATGGVGFYFSIRNGTLTEGSTIAYLTSILTGVGLLFARDANVTSVDMGVQGVTTNAKGEAVITAVGPKATEQTKDCLLERIEETKKVNGNGTIR